MKKIVSIFLVFAMTLVVSINVLAGAPCDSYVFYEKSTNADIPVNYTDATSIVSVTNDGKDITSNTEVISNTDGSKSLKIKSEYLQTVSAGYYVIVTTYNKVSGGTATQSLGLTVTSSIAPTVTPTNAKYIGKELTFNYSNGTGPLTSNIIKNITYNGINLSSADYSYSAITNKITINDSFLSTKAGTLDLKVEFDNQISTNATISINCDYTQPKPVINAEIVSSLDFGLTKVSLYSNAEAYKIIRNDNLPFPYSEFDSQFASSPLNIVGPVIITIEKDAKGNAIMKVLDNSPASNTSVLQIYFDVLFTKKATSTTDTIKFTGTITPDTTTNPGTTDPGTIPTDPTTIQNVVKNYDNFSQDNSNTFNNQLSNYTFNVNNKYLTIQYTGTLNGKYDFNFDSAIDTKFESLHRASLGTIFFNSITVPAMPSFPGTVSMTIKNLDNYANPVLYKMNSDGTLSELAATYNSTTKLFLFTTNKLAYGYLVSNAPIHNSGDKDVSSGYGSTPGTTNPGTTNPGTTNPGTNPNNNPDTGLINFTPIVIVVGTLGLVLLLINKRKQENI